MSSQRTNLNHRKRLSLEEAEFSEIPSKIPLILPSKHGETSSINNNCKKVTRLQTEGCFFILL